MDRGNISTPQFGAGDSSTPGVSRRAGSKVCGRGCTLIVLCMGIQTRNSRSRVEMLDKTERLLVPSKSGKVNHSHISKFYCVLLSSIQE